MAAQVMGPSRAVLLALIGIMLVSHSNALTDVEKSSINSGLDSGVKVFESIASFGDPAKSTTFKKLGKMVSFLGAAGGFVSFVLAFLPSQDSAELAYMKKQFTLVNTKLDKITSKLDDIKNLITYENQRSVYISSSHHVLHGHRRLSAFIKEVQQTSCGSKSACKRVRARIATRYLNSLNVKPHLDKILRGTYSRTSVFGESLLMLVRKTSKCNFREINRFTNGILKLAFKGQQVVLAYEKLMGSKHSIAQSLKDWLNNIYRLRSMSFRVKNACFKNVKHQMRVDIRNSDYQIKSPTNKAANKAVKAFLERKYPWLGVVAFSYNAYGGDKHCTTDTYHGLWSMPKDKNARKRNLIVGVTDKTGTYLGQKYKVMNALDTIVDKVTFYREQRDYCKILSKLRIELKKRNVWKYVASLNVRKKSYGLDLLANNDLTYISAEYSLKRYRRSRKGSIKTLIVIVLKSMEQAAGRTCKLKCKNGGQCISYPMSSAQYCQCKPDYQGDLCKEHSKAKLAQAIDSMLDVTLKLPVLSDLHFDIKDLRQFVGINFANMQKGISNLESSMQRKFNQLSGTIKDQMKWANFLVMYRNAIQTIEYYAHRFEKLPTEHKDKKELEKSGKKLAISVLNDHSGIRKALFQLNNLLIGKVNKPLLSHKPILLAFMESRSKAGEPCTKGYKARVDNYWRQLLLLQQIGYMVWAQAREFAGMKTSFVSNSYTGNVDDQLSVITTRTCKYDVRNSINIHCNGHYLHPRMTIHNRCKGGYYVHGSVQTSCKSKRSSCRACGCFPQGSRSQQCTNIHARCSCKPGFYGQKCKNRNCVWNNWSPYGHCLNCGYGAKKARRRGIKVTAFGTGAKCRGSSVSYASCFKGCCWNNFHCSNKRKCIPRSWKCDYDNDCGDKQDERGCNERCYTRYTWFNDHGGGRLVYLDRHQPYCRHREAMKMFHLQTSGNRVRYQYICCKMTRNLCGKRIKKNRFTYAVHHSRAQYLKYQAVSCGLTGYVSSFRLQRSSNHRAIRYEYNCCNLHYRKHKRRTSCYHGYTGWTDGSNGKSYYLDRQTVRCRNRYFINTFHLQVHNRWWGKKNFRYYYRCCRVVA